MYVIEVWIWKKRGIKRLVAARIFLPSLLGITRLDCYQNSDAIENTFQELTVKLKAVQELTKKLMQNEDQYNTKLESEVESTEVQTYLTRPQRKVDIPTTPRSLWTDSYANCCAVIGGDTKQRVAPNLIIVQQDATVFSLLYFCRQLCMFQVLTPISCYYSFWHWSTGSTTTRSRSWVGTDSGLSVPTEQRERMIVDPVDQCQKL